MASIFRKAVSLLSVSAVAASIMPMATAATGDVFYDEDFEGFPLETLVTIAPGGNTNDDIDGYVFSTAGTRETDSGQISIAALSEGGNSYLQINALKYNDKGARRPLMELTRTTGTAFESDMIVKFDYKTGAANNQIIVRSSNNKQMIYTKPNSNLNEWVTVTLVQSPSDGKNYTVVESADGALLSYEESALTELEDIKSIGVLDAGATTNKNSIDNLYIADDEYELPPSIVMDAAYNSIVINPNQIGMVYDEELDVYTVRKSIALPENPAGAEVEWVVEQSLDGESWEPTAFAEVNGTTLEVYPTEDSINYDISVKAIVRVGELEREKSFNFKIELPDPNEPVVYYGEDFSSIPEGNLVNLGSNSNTTYRQSNGLVFGCGTRDSDTGVTGIDVVTDSANSNIGKYINLKQTKYTDQGRQPYVNLVNTAGTAFNNGMLLSFNVKYSAASDKLIIKDSKSQELEFSAPDGYVDTWLEYTIGKADGKPSIIIKDAEGSIIDFYSLYLTLEDIAAITTPDIIIAGIGIDNISVIDCINTLSDDDIAAAAVKNVAINMSQKAFVDGVATADIVLPDTPEGVELSWSVEQEDAEHNVTPSEFIKIDGSKAVIAPTADTKNYDVYIVATVTRGEGSSSRRTLIKMLDPTDEVSAVEATNFAEVTTLENAENKFDLTNPETVINTDLKLPTTSSASKYVTISWAVKGSSDRLTIEDGTATISVKDLEVEPVVLTATIKYSKAGYTSEPVVKEYPVKVGITKADIDAPANDDGTSLMDKYKVRGDVNSETNFAGIPSTAAGSITLPTVGEFGSKISWVSSSSVISSSGTIKAPTNTTTVELTAKIECGDVSETKTFKVIVNGTGSTGGSTGGVSGGGGGGTIAKGNTVLAAVQPQKTADEINEQLKKELEEAGNAFRDLGSVSWARDAINGLAAKGIVNGKSSDSFAPNDSVTRAEFIKMLMSALELNSDAFRTSSFGDVSTDAWYFVSVETAYNLGIVTGADGRFNPNAEITRQDMAVMLVRAAQVSGKTFADGQSKNFADASSIAPYARDAVDTLSKAGVINGISETEFAPCETATRAQAAKLLFGIL